MVFEVLFFLMNKINELMNKIVVGSFKRVQQFISNWHTKRMYEALFKSGLFQRRKWFIKSAERGRLFCCHSMILGVIQNLKRHIRKQFLYNIT